jgi:hypothetical protein
MKKAERDAVLMALKELRAIAYNARREQSVDAAVRNADELITLLEHEEKAEAARTPF